MSTLTGRNALNGETSGDHYEIGDVTGTGIAIGRGAHVSVHQVQIFYPPANGESPLGKGEGPTVPYTLDHFKISERNLFTGRDQEIKWIIAQLNGTERIAVIRGLAGIGKTSLLTAGVIPQLIRHQDLVIQLKDYNPPVYNLQNALFGFAQAKGISVDQSTSITSIAKIIYENHPGILVVILDQIERLFDRGITQDQQDAFVRALEDLRNIFSATRFRLLISIRKENSEQLVPLFEKAYPSLRNASIELSPFNREQAQYAIEHPLKELGYPVSYSPNNFVEYQLVPDLDKVYSIGQNQIHPADLQIVCYRLFQSAFGGEPPHITETLYDEISHGKRAKAIVASYLKAKLQDVFDQNLESAQEIIKGITLSGDGNWISPNLIPFLQQEGSHEILEKLVEQNFLIWRNVNSHREYRFANHAMTTAAKNWFAPGIDSAPARLNRVWQAWVAEDGLATERQLQLLSQNYRSLSPTPVQAILLMNSAIAQRNSPYPWLEIMKQPQNADLIRVLEKPDDHSIKYLSDREDQEDAKSLLGIPSAIDALKSQSSENDYGSVAQTAVNHIDSIKRQTSVLALFAAYPQAALTRLENALKDSRYGRSRRAELRGTLADADSYIEQQNKGINSTDRFLIWFWRVRHRLVNDRNRLLGYFLGGAVGAGLGLGLWRGITGGLAGFSIGIHFAVNAFTGSILGGLLTLGMTLAASLQPRSTPTAAGDREQSLPPSPLLVIILGALIFGIGNILVTTLTGLSITARTTIFLGFTAGAGLSIALYDQPLTRWQDKRTRIIFRWIAVIFLFGVIQWFAGNLDITGLSFVWPGSTFCSNASAIFGNSCDSLSINFPEWENLASSVDAAFTALFLTIGIALGLFTADNLIKKWNSLIPRN